ncbi:MAG: metallopeptidase family protein [Chloroflexi bacterium]|nr:metallopeptidase family protein [Chloroflexota bacterium]
MTARRERLAAFRATSRRFSLTRRAFERLVEQALAELPPEFAERLVNVAVTVEDRPDPARLAGLGFEADESLLGLFEGTPLGQRGDYHLAVPDRITIFRLPILQCCQSEEDVVREVRATVIHEVGHFFGLGDQELT